VSALGFDNVDEAVATLSHEQRRVLLMALLEAERDAARLAVKRSRETATSRRIALDAGQVQRAAHQLELARQAFDAATRAVDMSVLQLANARGDGPLSGTR